MFTDLTPEYLRDTQEGGSTSHIHVGDSVQWNWLGGFHSTTSGPWPPCTQNADRNWNSGAGSGTGFTHKFNSAGTSPYYCNVHTTSMTATVIVAPARPWAQQASLMVCEPPSLPRIYPGWEVKATVTPDTATS